VRINFRKRWKIDGHDMVEVVTDREEGETKRVVVQYSTEHGRVDDSGEQATWADGQGRK
jgi:hypothetical protein